MIDDNKLMDVAEAAAKQAYAPYSKFKVGAAILSSGGRIFSGGNVENASYSLSLCAERAALTAAVSAGERDFSKIAVWAAKKSPVWPCGACLQTLAEFGPELAVIARQADGTLVTRKLKELLPEAFTLPEKPNGD